MEEDVEDVEDAEREREGGETWKRWLRRGKEKICHVSQSQIAEVAAEATAREETYA